MKNMPINEETLNMIDSLITKLCEELIETDLYNVELIKALAELISTRANI